MKNTNAVFIICLVSLACSQLQFRCGTTEKYCRDDQTCCLLPQGSYGCCPYINGECCSDGQHCCPYGYECNLPKLRCDKKADNYFLEMLMPDQESENVKLYYDKANLITIKLT